MAAVTPSRDAITPRSYRGKASNRQGHTGVRTAAGTWAPMALERKRWTTALRTEALDHLHELAAAAGVNRCEVVEALLLDPLCRERVLATLLPDLTTEQIPGSISSNALCIVSLPRRQAGGRD